MRSDLHKVLHPLAGKPMLMHLLDTVDTLEAERRVVVVGTGREQLEGALAGHQLTLALQAEQKGTGHAVAQAAEALAGFDGTVLVLYGDTPCIETATLQAMQGRLEAEDRPGVVVLASSPDDPASYGRVVLGQGDTIARMVEYKDASPEERAVRLCNSGMMAVAASDLFRWLAKVGNDNAAGEYYLPDIVMVAAAEGRHSVAVECDPWQTAGINSRSELALVERDWQGRRRAQAMAEGATLFDPDTVWFSADTRLGRDVLVEPSVFFGPGVSVADGAVIRAFSHLEGASVGAGAEVGPYARLRPGAELGERSKVGNFVEIKKAKLGARAKANHLSYIGDADVGAGANIGAGTITCNYDGFFKYQTRIGEGAFIGSNSSLVAPVNVGAGAIVGAGSVVTRDVEGDALGVTRAEQKQLSGWAAHFRERQSAKKGK
ncbi:bifunctional UDP-N-acetylglucosamine pyrophosphorylase/glucosamine-1-phosphate N-acetyltransferase [Sphingomonas kaistensis]|uniref:Bifunctional protein GlmU n=2 Tax=Sphingomonas kaistensis TaxID=298708 RepID=A0A7X6BHU5_9SPHN|nr:bifunctional UDP-N-acetylglucosamine pyrophosphorylase/glucosamine-1-phosphate N-acetyltransferase [Sphingomonas kaistensis]